MISATFGFFVYHSTLLYSLYHYLKILANQCLPKRTATSPGAGISELRLGLVVIADFLLFLGMVSFLISRVPFSGEIKGIAYPGGLIRATIWGKTVSSS